MSAAASTLQALESSAHRDRRLVVVFLVPFAFIVLTAVEDRSEAALLSFSLADQWQLLAELRGRAPGPRLHADRGVHQQHDPDRRQRRHHGGLRPRWSRYVLQRRRSRWNHGRSTCSILSGLIIPPAVVPTIWVLQELGLFKTMPGLILVEVAFGLSFCILLFRAFIADDPAGARRGGDHRRRRPAAAVLPGHLPAAEAGHRHRRRGPVGDVFNDFAEPAVLPARRRERDRAADALQLPEPVRTASTTCCSWTSC